MGHVDVNQVSFDLPDGRPLLREVSLRVGEGAKAVSYTHLTLPTSDLV